MIGPHPALVEEVDNFTADSVRSHEPRQSVQEKLTAIFKMSLSATAIRLVEYGSYPAMLICSTSTGREWYVASSTVNGKLWPLDRPGKSTQAAALLQGHVAAAGPQDRRAAHSISRSSAPSE